MDLPHAIFEHFCNQVKETREDGKNKSRLWIGNGRLISDILIESGLVDHLHEAGQSDILRTICGKPMDGRSLFRLKLIDEVQTEPQDVSQESLKKRRVRVEDFPLWTAEEPIECLLYYIESCQKDGIPFPPDLLEQARRPAPGLDLGRKRKMKQKAVDEEPQKKKKKKNKITIKNKGIFISENPILNSLNIDSTIITTNTPSENQQVSEQTTDHIMTDIPEQNISVPENIAAEQVVSEHSAPENLVSEQNVSEQNASVHIVSEQVASENIVSERNVSEQAVSENNISDNIISGQNTFVSENINPDNTPSKNIVSDQPIPVTPIQSEPPNESPENENPSEQQQQQQQSEPHTSPSPQNPPEQSSQQNIPENTVAKENINSETTEKIISEASETLPETSPVFDDFSKTNFFSGISADETHHTSDQIPENNAQIVYVLTENPTPLKTLVDLTLTSDTDNNSDLQSDTSSGSSFDADAFISDLMSRRKRSENRFVVPPYFFPKRTVVDKMLRNFEYDLKTWLTNLNKKCSESYDPIEAHQLFTQFRKRFNTAAATIQDVVCQTALKNLQN